MTTYFAIIHEDRDSAVGVVFPDLPGCFSAGDTLDEAIANAQEALRLYAEAEHAAGRRLPEPRTFSELYRDRAIREEAKGAPFIGIQLATEAGPPRDLGAKRSAKGGSQTTEKRKRRATS
jgi:predicted RNase H-like HicB family nuclease